MLEIFEECEPRPVEDVREIIEQKKKLEEQKKKFEELQKMFIGKRKQAKRMVKMQLKRKSECRKNVQKPLE